MELWALVLIHLATITDSSEVVVVNKQDVVSFVLLMIETVDADHVGLVSKACPGLSASRVETNSLAPVELVRPRNDSSTSPSSALSLDWGNITQFACFIN